MNRERGRGRGRRGRRKVEPMDLQTILNSSNDSADMPTTWNIRNIQDMLCQATSRPLSHHQSALKANRALYAAVLITLDSVGVELSSSTKIRIVAATLSAKHTVDLGIHILKSCLAQTKTNGWQIITIAELVGALNMLDARRKIRACVRKINKLAAEGASNKCKSFRRAINTLNKVRSVEIPSVGSLSGSLVRLLKKKWCRSLSPGYLRDQAQMTSATHWRELAGMLHIADSDFQLPWFLPWVNGKLPANSELAVCNTLKAQLTAGKELTNLVELIEAKTPWALLRKVIKGKDLTTKQKIAIASYTTMDTVLWWHEDFVCDDVNIMIEKRLEAGERPQFGYGALLERLVYFQNSNACFLHKLVGVAEERLKDVRVALQSVLVAGDASDSMTVAIRTATIISSLVSNVVDRQAHVKAKDVSTPNNTKPGAVTGSLFRLFTYKPVPVPKAPTSVADILNFASTIKANGMTAPAAAVHQLLASRQKVEQLIFVTDEAENTPFPAGANPTFFVDALGEYREKVNPDVQLIIVSFAEKSFHSSMGNMEESVRKILKMTPVVFTLNPRSPDLKKLDSLIGLLASQGAWFQHRVKDICTRLQSAWTEPFLPGLLDEPQQRFVASCKNPAKLCAALMGLVPLKKASPAVFAQAVNAILVPEGYVPPASLPPAVPESTPAMGAHEHERQRQQRVATLFHEVEKCRDTNPVAGQTEASAAKKACSNTKYTAMETSAMTRLPSALIQRILIYLRTGELVGTSCVCRKVHMQFTSLPILKALYGPGSNLLYDKHEAQGMSWTKVTQQESDYFAQLQSQFGYW